MQLSESQFARAMRFARQYVDAGFRIVDDAICIGTADQLNSAQRKELLAILESMRPFRKGPFEIFGTRIDANWKSDRKWDRLKQYLPDLADLKKSRICDIGCNNGYFMFRLHELLQQELNVHAGEFKITGLDPVLEHRQRFDFFNTMANCSSLEFIPEGFEYLSNKVEQFDLILCLGILYHHTDPIRILRLAHAALRKGGMLIVESLGIPESQAHAANCLIPLGRYAGMRGVWQVPDRNALLAWLKRSGLQRPEFLEQHAYEEEQVRSAWGDLPGLQEVLDPGDNLQTIEGYPAPLRLWARAFK